MHVFFFCRLSTLSPPFAPPSVWVGIRGKQLSTVSREGHSAASATTRSGASPASAVRRRDYCRRLRARIALRKWPRHSSARLRTAAKLLRRHHGTTPAQPFSRRTMAGLAPVDDKVNPFTVVGGRRQGRVQWGGANPFAPLASPVITQVWACSCGGARARTNFMSRTTCVECGAPGPAGAGQGHQQARTSHRGQGRSPPFSFTGQQQQPKRTRSQRRRSSRPPPPPPPVHKVPTPADHRKQPPAAPAAAGGGQNPPPLHAKLQEALGKLAACDTLGMDAIDPKRAVLESEVADLRKRIEESKTPAQRFKTAKKRLGRGG